MMMGVRNLKGKVKYAGRNGNNGRQQEPESNYT